ncbi:hypothetical protein Syun_003303 [Stephania yunnanensis]|uniref:Uncharacterized protein n=1 Tax=Stephania yunnanensis TaxID=152371 RepID=A0AAP0Q3S1_9MAGN
MRTGSIVLLIIHPLAMIWCCGNGLTILSQSDHRRRQKEGEKVPQSSFKVREEFQAERKGVNGRSRCVRQFDEHIEQDELNAANGFTTEESASKFSDSVSVDTLSNHSIHLRECDVFYSREKEPECINHQSLSDEIGQMVQDVQVANSTSP